MIETVIIPCPRGAYAVVEKRHRMNSRIEGDEGELRVKKYKTGKGGRTAGAGMKGIMKRPKV